MTVVGAGPGHMRISEHMTVSGACPVLYIPRKQVNVLLPSIWERQVLSLYI